uniref:Uncharacterized protein n=1 Tax=Arundo donax TaxID=35708 RepID=A0A0A8YGC4_ARUDO
MDVRAKQKDFMCPEISSALNIWHTISLRHFLVCP